jgi:hypothetical protein
MVQRIETVAVRLAQQQLIVRDLIERIDAGGGWDAEAQRESLDRLLELGHFPEYSGELNWTPIEVVGHLTDGATIFSDRIFRTVTEEGPRLVDFDTVAPERIDRYRATARKTLVNDLAGAQRLLYRAVRTAERSELDRTAVHESLGEITLGDMLDFLVGHQADHAMQLTELFARRTKEDF